MAELVLTRIDSRLIHGQVVTKWVGQSGANRIIVVSDELVNDEFMKNIYLMAAPPSVKVDVYGTEEAGKLWKEDQFGTGKVLLLILIGHSCPYFQHLSKISIHCFNRMINLHWRIKMR